MAAKRTFGPYNQLSFSVVCFQYMKYLPVMHGK